MALITGDSGSITYTGGQTLIVADFGAWELQEDRPVHEYTKFSYNMVSLAVGQVRGTGTLEAAFDTGSTTPPVPNGTSGTLSLFINGTKKYYGPAILHGLEMGVASRGGAPISVYRYRFSFSSSTSSDTIQVA